MCLVILPFQFIMSSEGRDRQEVGLVLFVPNLAEMEALSVLVRYLRGRIEVRAVVEANLESDGIDGLQDEEAFIERLEFGFKETAFESVLEVDSLIGETLGVGEVEGVRGGSRRRVREGKVRVRGGVEELERRRGVGRRGIGRRGIQRRRVREEGEGGGAPEVGDGDSAERAGDEGGGVERGVEAAFDSGDGRRVLKRGREVSIEAKRGVRVGGERGERDDGRRRKREGGRGCAAAGL